MKIKLQDIIAATTLGRASLSPNHAPLDQRAYTQRSTQHSWAAQGAGP